MKKPIKILIICIIAAASLSLVKYIFLPTPYKHGDWGQVSYYGHLKYDFCKYIVPETYKYTDYREGRNKRLIVYTNQKTDQLFIVSKFREFLKINFDNISVKDGKIRRPFRFEGYSINNKFDLMYMLPFFRDDELKGASDGIAIKGFKVEGQEEFSTAAADIKYFSGTFTEIGFYKPGEGFFMKYPVPVFKFFKKNKGAIALIKDKKTGDTIVSIGCNVIYKDFNEEEYKNILKTVTFETEKWKDEHGVRPKGTY